MSLRTQLSQEREIIGTLQPAIHSPQTGTTRLPVLSIGPIRVATGVKAATLITIAWHARTSESQLSIRFGGT